MQLLTFNPIRSLESKHILFYYRADYLALECRRSGLRQVTKTNKMSIRKEKMLANNTIVIRIIHIMV